VGAVGLLVGPGLPVGPVVGLSVGVGEGLGVRLGRGEGAGPPVVVSGAVGAGVKVGCGRWSVCRAARLAGGGNSRTGLLSSVSRTASVQVLVG